MEARLIIHRILIITAVIPDGLALIFKEDNYPLKQSDKRVEWEREHPNLYYYYEPIRIHKTKKVEHPYRSNDNVTENNYFNDTEGNDNDYVQVSSQYINKTKMKYDPSMPEYSKRYPKNYKLTTPSKPRFYQISSKSTGNQLPEKQGKYQEKTNHESTSNKTRFYPVSSKTSSNSLSKKGTEYQEIKNRKLITKKTSFYPVSLKTTGNPLLKNHGAEYQDITKQKLTSSEDKQKYNKPRFYPISSVKTSNPLLTKYSAEYQKISNNNYESTTREKLNFNSVSTEKIDHLSLNEFYAEYQEILKNEDKFVTPYKPHFYPLITKVPDFSSLTEYISADDPDVPKNEDKLTTQKKQHLHQRSSKIQENLLVKKNSADYTKILKNENASISNETHFYPVSKGLSDSSSMTEYGANYQKTLGNEEKFSFQNKPHIDTTFTERNRMATNFPSNEDFHSKTTTYQTIRNLIEKDSLIPKPKLYFTYSYMYTPRPHRKTEPDNYNDYKTTRSPKTLHFTYRYIFQSRKWTTDAPIDDEIESENDVLSNPTTNILHFTYKYKYLTQTIWNTKPPIENNDFTNSYDNDFSAAETSENFIAENSNSARQTNKKNTFVFEKYSNFSDSDSYTNPSLHRKKSREATSKGSNKIWPAEQPIHKEHFNLSYSNLTLQGYDSHKIKIDNSNSTRQAVQDNEAVFEKKYNMSNSDDNSTENSRNTEISREITIENSNNTRLEEQSHAFVFDQNYNLSSLDFNNTTVALPIKKSDQITYRNSTRRAINSHVFVPEKNHNLSNANSNNKQFTLQIIKSSKITLVNSDDTPHVEQSLAFVFKKNYSLSNSNCNKTNDILQTKHPLEIKVQDELKPHVFMHDKNYSSFDSNNAALQTAKFLEANIQNSTGQSGSPFIFVHEENHNYSDSDSNNTKAALKKVYFRNAKIQLLNSTRYDNKYHLVTYNNTQVNFSTENPHRTKLTYSPHHVDNINHTYSYSTDIPFETNTTNDDYLYSINNTDVALYNLKNMTNSTYSDINNKRIQFHEQNKSKNNKIKIRNIMVKMFNVTNIPYSKNYGTELEENFSKTSTKLYFDSTNSSFVALLVENTNAIDNYYELIEIDDSTESIEDKTKLEKPINIEE